MKECVCLRGAADTSFTLVCPERHSNMIIVLDFVIEYPVGTGTVYIAANSIFTAVCLMKGATIPCFISRSALTTELQSDPGHITFKQMKPGTDLVLHPLRVYSSPLHQLSISSAPVSAPLSPGTA